MSQGSFTTFPILIGFLGSVTVFVSCKKAEPIPLPENCYCCQQTDAPDQIEIGNLFDMNILFPDTTITFPSYSGPSISCDFDLDQDGTHDLRFLRTDAGSYTTGPLPETSIIPLNEETFLQVSTSFDTLYYYETLTYHSSNPVVKTIHYHKNCVANSATDSVVFTSNYLKFYQNGESLDLNQSWTNDAKILAHYSKNAPLFLDETNPDTSVLYQDHYNNSCHDIANDTPTYIGIKKNACGEEKLGWIKLTLSSTSLLVSEITLQR